MTKLIAIFQINHNVLFPFFLLVGDFVTINNAINRRSKMLNIVFMEIIHSETAASQEIYGQ